MYCKLRGSLEQLPERIVMPSFIKCVKKTSFPTHRKCGGVPFCIKIAFVRIFGGCGKTNV